MGIGNIANTGMRAAMSDMEVISNNISNGNTIGFKRSRASFSDFYPNATGYGTQAGLGVKLTGIQQNFSIGGITPTDRPLDISIGTDGFFILKDKITGRISYTRAGRFDLDPTGYIKIGNNRLQGFPASNGLISAGSNLVDLQINNTPRSATETSQVSKNVNLDANATAPSGTFSDTDPATYNYKTDKTIYDSLGNTYSLSVFYVKTATNTWDAHVEIDGASVGTGVLTFDTSGNLTSATGLSSLNFTPGAGAKSPQLITVDLSGSTQYAGSFDSRHVTQNGYPVGKLNGYEIDRDGKVIAIYSNEERVLTGKIALAQFQSPEGLASIGNMSWVETSDSGTPIINATTSDGKINQGSLESSNVDLTEEMVNLIGAQHNFQANAQVEQTYNEVMKTIINI